MRNKLKILMLPAYFFPEQTASSHLNKDRYKAFAKVGFEMELYVPTPTRGIDDDTRNKYKKINHENAFDGQMEIFRFSMYREGKNPVLRGLRYSLCFIKQLYYGLKAQNINVIYLVSTPPIQGILGGVLKKLKKIPFVYNLQDIFPDSLVGSGLAKHGGILWKIGRIIENYTYRNADKIIVISEDFKKNIMAKGVPEERIEVVYNWVNDKNVVPIKKEINPLFDEFGISRNHFNVIYAGNFGNAQNIDVTIGAAELLRNETDIKFLLFGTGGLVEHYRHIVKTKNLDNVKFFPLQSVERVSYVYGLGDIGIVACKKGLGKGAFPSKTWSIMASGIPVIANYDTDTDLEKLITQNKLGVFTEAGNAIQMADQILELSKNRRLCKELGANARHYIENNISVDIATGKYINVIREVVKNSQI